MITYFDGMMKSFGIDRVHLFYADSIEIETIADAVWAIWAIRALNTNAIKWFFKQKNQPNAVLEYVLSAFSIIAWVPWMNAFGFG